MPIVHTDTPSILLDLNEGASALRVSRSTMKRLIGEGRLPVVRIGRRVLLRRDALETFLEENTQSFAADGASPKRLEQLERQSLKPT